MVMDSSVGRGKRRVKWKQMSGEEDEQHETVCSDCKQRVGWGEKERLPLLRLLLHTGSAITHQHW